jgi:hypothetical protein
VPCSPGTGPPCAPGSRDPIRGKPGSSLTCTSTQVVERPVQAVLLSKKNKETQRISRLYFLRWLVNIDRNTSKSQGGGGSGGAHKTTVTCNICCTKESPVHQQAICVLLLNRVK